MVCARRHMECKFFPSAQPQVDDSYVGVRLRGLSVAVIALYLDNEKDRSFVSRDSVAKLQAVLLLVKSLGFPSSLESTSVCLPAG